MTVAQFDKRVYHTQTVLDEATEVTSVICGLYENRSESLSSASRGSRPTCNSSKILLPLCALCVLVDLTADTNSHSDCCGYSWMTRAISRANSLKTVLLSCPTRDTIWGNAVYHCKAVSDFDCMTMLVDTCLVHRYGLDCTLQFYQHIAVVPVLRHLRVLPNVKP